MAGSQCWEEETWKKLKAYGEQTRNKDAPAESATPEGSQSCMIPFPRRGQTCRICMTMGRHL